MSIYERHLKIKYLYHFCSYIKIILEIFLLRSFFSHFSLSFCFFKTFSLPFPSHLAFLFPSSTASFHSLKMEKGFIKIFLKERICPRRDSNSGQNLEKVLSLASRLQGRKKNLRFFLRPSPFSNIKIYLISFFPLERIIVEGFPDNFPELTITSTFLRIFLFILSIDLAKGLPERLTEVVINGTPED